MAFSASKRELFGDLHCLVVGIIRTKRGSDVLRIWSNGLPEVEFPAVVGFPIECVDKLSNVDSALESACGKHVVDVYFVGERCTSVFKDIRPGDFLLVRNLSLSHGIITRWFCCHERDALEQGNEAIEICPRNMPEIVDLISFLPEYARELLPPLRRISTGGIPRACRSRSRSRSRQPSVPKESKSERKDRRRRSRSTTSVSMKKERKTKPVRQSRSHSRKPAKKESPPIVRARSRARSKPPSPPPRSSPEMPFDNELFDMSKKSASKSSKQTASKAKTKDDQRQKDDGDVMAKSLIKRTSPPRRCKSELEHLMESPLLNGVTVDFGSLGTLSARRTRSSSVSPGGGKSESISMELHKDKETSSARKQRAASVPPTRIRKETIQTDDLQIVVETKKRPKSPRKSPQKSKSIVELPIGGDSENEKTPPKRSRKRSASVSPKKTPLNRSRSRSAPPEELFDSSPLKLRSPSQAKQIPKTPPSTKRGRKRLIRHENDGLSIAPPELERSPLFDTPKSRRGRSKTPNRPLAATASPANDDSPIAKKKLGRPPKATTKTSSINLSPSTPKSTTISLQYERSLVWTEKGTWELPNLDATSSSPKQKSGKGRMAVLTSPEVSKRTRAPPILPRHRTTENSRATSLSPEELESGWSTKKPKRNGRIKKANEIEKWLEKLGNYQDDVEPSTSTPIVEKKTRKRSASVPTSKRQKRRKNVIEDEFEPIDYDVPLAATESETEEENHRGDEHEAVVMLDDVCDQVTGMPTPKKQLNPVSEEVKPSSSRLSTSAELFVDDDVPVVTLEEEDENELDERKAMQLTTEACFIRLTDIGDYIDVFRKSLQEDCRLSCTEVEWIIRDSPIVAMPDCSLDPEYARFFNVEEERPSTSQSVKDSVIAISPSLLENTPAITLRKWAFGKKQTKNGSGLKSKENIPRSPPGDGPPEKANGGTQESDAMAGLHLAITDDEEEQEPEPQKLPAVEEESSTAQNDEENEDTVLDFDEFIREMQFANLTNSTASLSQPSPTAASSSSDSVTYIGPVAKPMVVKLRRYVAKT